MKPSTRNRFARSPQAPATIADANGTAFDPERHVATDQLTKSGLFRLKPGKRRA